ncbi:MAG: class I SAM-dependent methyltransferase [Verrucomicrobiota bacterium]
MTVQDIEIFRDTWSLYDRILGRNYMFHDEIFRDVSAVLATRYPQGSYRLLDLGCGNARHLSASLRPCAPALYAGYDLSSAALCQARDHLASLSCPVDLRQADFQDAFRRDDGRFEVIFSSFAVHHLSSQDKQSFLKEARYHLAPGGCLLMADTSREPDEDRPEYLRNYCAWIRSDWRTLSETDLASVEEHIRTRDFPESNAAIHEMATAAGFQRCTDLPKYHWHRTWLMEP